MAKSRVFEGTWDELSEHADELRVYPKLTLIVPSQFSNVENRYRADLSVEERIKALDAAAEKNRSLPVLPANAFERENLYADEREYE